MQTTLLAVALTELIRKVMPTSVNANYYILLTLVLVMALTALEKYVPGYQDFVPGLVEGLTAVGLWGTTARLLKKTRPRNM
ncbi:MAG: A118-like holin [Siphoviridae sp. ctvD11]|nr:MAG: A118-like holin [Siphoviridae sp. ctvD11]